MIPRRAAFIVAATFLVAAACTGPAASPTPAPTTGSTAVCDNLPAGSEGDLLATICQRDKIVISTDADYAPQSSVTASGGYEGFDIDVGEEIGRRLGVQVEWSAQIWDTVIAGSWSGRWDMSVGSITVCCDRDQLFDFTQPYYYTPAQVAVLESSGITTLDGLAGQTVCVGEDTTYLYWVEGTLELAAPNRLVTEAPDGLTAFALETDANCAEAMRAGQTEVGNVFVTADPVIAQAIDADTPIVRIGEPIFYEALAVAFDKNGPGRAKLLETVDAIIGEMHADGTLSELSNKWYGVDYSKAD
jgi:polar amino acid transport system substrate-binding protein